MTDAAPEAPAAPPPQPAPSSSSSGGNRLTSIESSPILALLALGLGGYLAWFAVKYWRSQDVVWPSDPIKAILQGKPLPTSTTATTAEVQLTSYETSLAAAGQQTTTGTGGGGGGTPGGKVPPYKGGLITYVQAETYWRLAGGPANLAPTMAAIAVCESGLNPGAIQAGQPYATTGWGLWQITPGDSEPQFGIDHALLSPIANARAAVAKYKSQGLGAWTTYTDGCYRSHLQ